mgnify:CR=1 FL=1
MFGTSSNNLKLGDAVVKINGVIPERSKMDEEKLTPPASNSQGNAMNFYDLGIVLRYIGFAQAFFVIIYLYFFR